MYGIKVNGKMLSYYFTTRNEFVYTGKITDAQCYIGEMYSLGDYSNYYIMEVIVNE